jgi:hypothetical protein
VIRHAVPRPGGQHAVDAGIGGVGRQVAIERHDAHAHRAVLAGPARSRISRAVGLLTYKQGVDAFRVTDRLSDSDRAKLMGGTLQRVYDWAPSKS